MLWIIKEDFSSGMNVCNISSIVPGFDPSFLFRVLRHRARIQSLLLFWVLRHHTQIRSLLLISGSLSSCLDLILSFCFGFSNIVPRFDPFFCFRVLWHYDRIRSLLFILSSRPSCPNSILSFLFRVLQHYA